MQLEEIVRENPKLNMVTGTFSYTGKYITQKLISLGERVRTLTGHPEKKLDKQVEVFPYNFNKPEKLVESFHGVDTFYNTYWIRFSYGEMIFDKAIDNTKILIEAAEKAGVKRIVHISVINADEKSSFPYFRGKGIVEKIIQDSGLNYAILRPALIFGKQNSIINNIAWLLRNFPFFAVFGDGNYKLQPIYVEDLAELAVEAGNNNKNTIINAIGETFTFNEFVYLIKDKIGSKAKILHLSPSTVLFFSEMISKSLNDILVTKDEADGLMMNLLYCGSSVIGKTRFSSWLEENTDIGINYMSQLKMHYIQ